MRQPHLILITGLPGTGKSTLARALARRYAVPLICKDTIKEPLFDTLGAPDREATRRLSNASFAVMFSLLQDCLSAGTDVILEGNFRPGEHEAPILASFAQSTAPPRIAQILCEVPESIRIERLQARATDPSRHPGHRDVEFVLPHTSSANPSRPAVGFLSLPGERLILDTAEAQLAVSSQQALFDALDTQCGWRSTLSTRATMSDGSDS